MLWYKWARVSACPFACSWEQVSQSIIPDGRKLETPNLESLGPSYFSIAGDKLHLWLEVRHWEACSRNWPPENTPHNDGRYVCPDYMLTP